MVVSVVVFWLTVVVVFEEGQLGSTSMALRSKWSIVLLLLLLRGGLGL